MNRVFEDEFMEIQTEMVQIGVNFAEKAKGKVSRIFLLIFYQGAGFSASIFFKIGNRILEWKDVQIEGGFDTYINLFLQNEYEQAKQLRKLCKSAGRPCPEELRLVYDLVTEGFHAEYGYEVPKGICMNDLCEVWGSELRAQLEPDQLKSEIVTPQENTPAELHKSKKAGFKFPFIWKK